VRGLALAAFSFAGQRCTALRRFIVERPLLAEFQARFVEAVRALRIGKPCDPLTEVGPLISRTHSDAVLGKVRQAVDQGGELLCGGDVPVGLETGCWLAPAVLTGVAADSPIFREETFGPVAVLLPANDLEHALSLANGVEHGLVAALYGGTAAQGRSFAAAIQAGIIKVGPGLLAIHAEAPFVGWKASGYGPPEHGEWDRQFFARPQAVYGNTAHGE
jgi:acyl-CoA reductase-like NAD-dependent aldehyde dehydrogenase